MSEGQDIAAVLRGPTVRDDARARSSVNVGTTERWASALAGAGMAVAGLSRRSPGGLALAAAGGMLLWRGVGGSCLLYSALGWSTADPAPRAQERGADRWPVRPTVPFGEAGSRLGLTRDQRLDEEIEQTFPASDAPTHMAGAAKAGAAPGRSDRD